MSPSFTTFASESATRRKAAFEALCTRLSDRVPMPPEIAHKVAVYYVKHKIVKLDPYHGVYSVCQGRMLDADVVSRCVEMVTE